jgi:hypothetical protein
VQSKFQLGPLLGNCPKILTAVLNYIFSPESWKNKKWLPHEGYGRIPQLEACHNTMLLTPCYVARGGICNEKMSFNLSLEKPT